jgi:hypothetical protein
MREDLCKKFCIYFNPSKKEKLACEGFAVIEKLNKIGKPVAFDEPDTMHDYASQKMLIQALCTHCPFYQDDCDFILAASSHPFHEDERQRPLPCGGFILLTHLLESKILQIDDIRNII